MADDRKQPKLQRLSTPIGGQGQGQNQDPGGQDLGAGSSHPTEAFPHSQSLEKRDCIASSFYCSQPFQHSVLAAVSLLFLLSVPLSLCAEAEL